MARILKLKRNKMNIELINWRPEIDGRIIRIDCKINEFFKSFYVLDYEVKKVLIEYFKKDGINETNICDFMKGKDPKYRIEEYHKLFFIKHFYTI